MEALATSDTAPSSGSAAIENAGLNGSTQVDQHLDASNTSTEKRGVKRPAEDDSFADASEVNDQTHCNSDSAPTENTSGDAVPLTKNQLKKLKRREKWEESKEGRRSKRRDKRHERQARKRVAKEEEIAAAAAEGREPVLNTGRNKSRSGVTVPVGIIIDCQFEKYMLETELVSLSSQVTRSYSDNRGALHHAHLYISSYGGVLKERNETVLENQHLKWKGVYFCEGDFVEAAKQANERMAGPMGGEVIDLLQQSASGESISLSTDTKRAKSAPAPEPEAEDVDKSIVYLTADSPYTLSRLEPNTCYVVGGIIDKNREKGLCYRIAREKNVRTAKLPIGEYMVLQHRHVLATNHVVEIMLKWLETGDWGTAFTQVIPTRKGGKLRADGDTPTERAEQDTVEESGDADVQVVDAQQADARESHPSENADNAAKIGEDNP
ncbi:hypothetical protein GGS21DRAFT_541646 [Xylaria nigripes]|nr:hypothetical protein GGS21DRAFT_541646 [Xylaria nigripes]